jgi:hypothetical protein
MLDPICYLPNQVPAYTIFLLIRVNNLPLYVLKLKTQNLKDQNSFPRSCCYFPEQVLANNFLIDTYKTRSVVWRKVR